MQCKALDTVGNVAAHDNPLDTLSGMLWLGKTAEAAEQPQVTVHSWNMQTFNFNVMLWQVNTKRDAKYTLKASYLEIYNEGVYDLVHFSPKAKSLPVKWDASYGFYVQGLKVSLLSALHSAKASPYENPAGQGTSGATVTVHRLKSLGCSMPTTYHRNGGTHAPHLPCTQNCTTPHAHHVCG